MILNINHQIWYKACRPLRHKYKLSTNCLMVLNGSFVYCSIVAPSFTMRKLIDFCSYYDNNRMKKYFCVLMFNKYVIENGMYKGHQMYSISSLGIQVIRELNDSYNKELSIFISKYNISL